MSNKQRLSRKKKKKLKIKKNNFVKNEASLSVDKDFDQNLESLDSSFDEKKSYEEFNVSQKDKKKGSLVNYPNKYLIFEIISLLLITSVIYYNTLDHSFHLDDLQNISTNPFTQISSLSINELTRAVTESVNNKRPVANISFALNYYFHGLDVTGYHIVNIIIHLLTGVMLFYFVRQTLSLTLVRNRFDDAKFIPFFTTLIWLVHPLQIQSVTYIVQRMNSMAAMFFILAMLFYVKGRVTSEKVNKYLFFTISFFAGLLAFGSKQNTATLPLFILFYEWYFFQNFRLKISRKQVVWIAALCCLFGFVLYFFLGSSPLSKLFSDYGGRPFTMAQRLLTQPRVVLHYISLIFYPAPGRLNLDYDFPLSYSLLSPPSTIIAILVIVGMLGLAIYSAKKNQLYSFCILWFLGNLVIESSTIPLEIIFEHRTYLPSMMVILLVLLLLHRVAKKKRVLIVCLAAVSLLFSYWAYERNKVWQDELTLWTDIYEKSPNKARVAQHYGSALYNADRIDEAFPILEKALNLYEMESRLQKTGYSYKMSTHNLNLGILYKDKGKYQKAIFYLNRALQYFYYSTTAHYHIGICYIKVRRFEEAVYHFNKALEFARHHSGEIGAYSNMAKIKKSLEFAKKALLQKDITQ